MAVKEVRIRGLEELERKLGMAVLVDPAMHEALETIGARLERQGKGLGARRNVVTREAHSMGARIVSTLKSPRQTGGSWVRKNEAIFNAMSGRVVGAAIRRIEARWAE